MNEWTDTSRTLPTEHEYVRFVVTGHSQALLGVYEHQSFHSRWGTYDKAHVRIWYKVGDAPHVPAPARAMPEQCC